MATKATKKPKAEKKEKAPGKDHNKKKPAEKKTDAISEKLILFHHRQMVALKDLLDKASSKYRKARKNAKGDGLNLKQYDSVTGTAKLSREEQTTGYNDAVRIGQALKVPMYAQLELFNVKRQDNSPEAINKRAFEEGQSDGVQGLPQATDKYDAGSEAGQKYLEGYSVGNKALAGALFQPDKK